MTTSWDDAAFAALVRAQTPRLRRYAAALVGGTGADPDDVLQEVWIRAHRSLPPDANAAAWLRTVTHNCAMDARRAADGASPLDDAVATAASGTVMDEVARRGDVRQLLADIAALDERQRRAFVRHVLDGSSHDAVAAELRSSPQGSRSLVHRARRNLQRRSDARAMPCADARAGLGDAHARGVRPSEDVRLHLQACAACRRHRAAVHPRRSRWAFLPAPGLKLAGLAAAASVAVGAGWSVTRSDVVEPWQGPESPSWTLGRGNAFSTHRVAFDPGERPRAIDLPLRCPAGYGLFQVDQGSAVPRVALVPPPSRAWLGAPGSRWRVRARPGSRRLPASFTVEVTCRRPRLLVREVGDETLRAAVVRNSRRAAPSGR
ncbi:MAG TPA: sigma-70 family RNA polymerase sigma factor [Solirubrobacteraceae bacterium]|jgi:RNA polymerase sigma factor (sigma-70 family)|nr:sigma-70 family RNA polymerase sigma factor [Solirubrobacteraceae bacterium]